MTVVKRVKPTSNKLRMQAKDGKWKTQNVEAIPHNKALIAVKANTPSKPGQITLQLPDDWSQELAGKEKGNSKFVLMRFIPSTRKAAKKVTKKKAVAKKK